MGLHLYYTCMDSLDMETFAVIFTFTFTFTNHLSYKNKMLRVSKLKGQLHAGNVQKFINKYCFCNKYSCVDYNCPYCFNIK